MTGGQRQFARATTLLIVLALCWRMAGTLAAAASSPVSPACCMRMAHGCHSHDGSGVRFESVCRTCGWCHALPNASAHLAATSVTFSFSLYHTAEFAEAESQPISAPSRLHASRGPPHNAIAES
jgi:hypothetical protein